MARAPRKGKLTLGPFLRGLNTAKSANRLDPDEATVCQNVDLTDGTLRGMYGQGTTVATVGASQYHIHYEDGLSWASDPSYQFHCYDTVYGTSGKRYSFYTTASLSAYANGSVTAKRLGIEAPGTAPTAGTGVAAARYYRYTYITNRAATTYSPMESNPSAAVRATTTTVNVTASADAAVDGIRIYASDGDTAGPYYLTDTFTNTTAAVTPSATNTASTLLSWEAGGRDTNATYIDDHSPAATPNTMSSALHTAALPGSILPCTGILFIGVGSTLLWSEVGYPWYFPTSNGFLIDSYIEGIVTDQATTYVLTETGIFVITGTDDEQLNFQRSRSFMGTVWGHSAVMTPYGLMFQATQGIALFDGNSSRIITDGRIAPADLTKNYAAVWAEDQLLLVSQSDSSGGYVLDFSAGLDGLRITTHNLPVRAITKADAFTTPATYVATFAAGLVGRWSPRQRANVGGASALAWSWTTGKMDAGMPTAPKRFVRLWVEASGTISIAVTAGNNANTTVGTTTLTGSDWLPASWGLVDWLQLAITSSDGTGIVHGIEVEYEATVAP